MPPMPIGGSLIDPEGLPGMDMAPEVIGGEVPAPSSTGLSLAGVPAPIQPPPDPGLMMAPQAPPGSPGLFGGGGGGMDLTPEVGDKLRQLLGRGPAPSALEPGAPGGDVPPEDMMSAEG